MINTQNLCIIKVLVSNNMYIMSASFSQIQI